MYVKTRTVNILWKLNAKARVETLKIQIRFKFDSFVLDHHLAYYSIEHVRCDIFPFKKMWSLRVSQRLRLILKRSIDCLQYTKKETVFYFYDKIWLLLLLAHSWFNSYAPELVPIFYYRDKTLVHVFYFFTNGITTFIWPLYYTCSLSK